MNIQLKDTTTGWYMTFPMLPEEIHVETATRFQSYDIMGVGEIKIPQGEELTKFSWKGMLPGSGRQNDPYVVADKDPKAMQIWLSECRNQGKKMRLTITETPIDHEVYLVSFTPTYSGGYGDYYYQIEFVVAKKLIISTEEPSKTSANPNVAAQTSNTSRPVKESPKTYKVKSGDSLWKIAQSQLGNGSLYGSIYSANQSVIDSKNKGKKIDKYTIYPGQSLTIPGKG